MFVIPWYLFLALPFDTLDSFFSLSRLGDVNLCLSVFEDFLGRSSTPKSFIAAFVRKTGDLGLNEGESTGASESVSEKILLDGIFLFEAEGTVLELIGFFLSLILCFRLSLSFTSSALLDVSELSLWTIGLDGTCFFFLLLVEDKLVGLLPL